MVMIDNPFNPMTLGIETGLSRIHGWKGCNVELRDVKCFLAVARNLSFARAAESLHLSTQATSQSVARLEAGLGFALFERTTRSVRLTPAGVRFRKDAERIMAELDESVELAARISSGKSGVVALGFDLAETLGTMPAVVSMLRSRHPDIEVQVASYNLPNYDDLRKGKLDAYFATSYNDAPEDFNCCVLRTMPLYAVLPKSHRLSEKEALTLADLRGETVITYQTSPESPILGHLRRASINYKFVADMGQMSSWWTLIGLAGAGYGIAFTSHQYRTHQSDLVDYRPMDEPGFVTQTCLFWNKRDVNPLVEGAVFKAAQAVFLEANRT